MKKSLLLFTLLIFSASSALFAQDEAESASSKNRFGLRMGLNYSSLDGGEYDAYDPRIDLVRGLYFVIPLSEELSLEPGMYYSLEGGERTYTEGENTYDQTLKLNYMDIPLLVRYTIGDGFYAFAGPEFSVNVYNKLETEFDELEKQEVENVQDIILSANIGMGYEFENQLNLRAMYSRSLNPVIKSTVSSPEDVNSNLFQLALGYTF